MENATSNETTTVELDQIDISVQLPVDAQRDEVAGRPVYFLPEMEMLTWLSIVLDDDIAAGLADAYARGTVLAPLRRHDTMELIGDEPVTVAGLHGDRLVVRYGDEGRAGYVAVLHVLRVDDHRYVAIDLHSPHSQDQATARATMIVDSATRSAADGGGG